MKIDYDECWYSNNSHNACTHQNYCIFNKNRWELESMISELENDLELVENQLNQFSSIYITKNYDELLKEKTLLINDLEDLRILRINIIDNEVREYGYEILES